MIKKTVRLSAVLFFLMLFVSISALFTHAEENKPAYSGYYTISSSVGAGVLSVAEEGSFALAETESEYSVFEILPSEAGGYNIRSVVNGGYLSISYDGGIRFEQNAEMPSARLNLISSNGAVGICADSEGMFAYLGVSKSEDGVASFVLGEDETNCWRITVCKPKSMTLSLKSVKTTPYVKNEDLRVVVSPSYLSGFVKWESSDRNLLVVDENGDFCALAEGEAVVTASLLGETLDCQVSISEDNAYAWYSQNNISTGGWNGDAVRDLCFVANGEKKPFAANGSTKKTDWLSEGCSLCSIAQILTNMGARYTQGYDFRSGKEGNIMADPYTVALANVGHTGPESGRVTLYGDPILTRHNAIAAAFNVDGKPVTVTQKYGVTKKAIKEALDACPWGVIVCFENKAYGTHYITFNRCLNPDATNPSEYIFTISDPAAIEPTIASDTVFEQSYAYKILQYRLGQAKLMQVWSYEE